MYQKYIKEFKYVLKTLVVNTEYCKWKTMIHECSLLEHKVCINVRENICTN